MSYVVGWRSGYLLKKGGFNLEVEDPSRASFFSSRFEASNSRPGHDKAMGGKGFVGTVMTYERAEANYKALQELRGPYW